MDVEKVRDAVRQFSGKQVVVVYEGLEQLRGGLVTMPDFDDEGLYSLSISISGTSEQKMLLVESIESIEACEQEIHGIHSDAYR